MKSYTLIRKGAFHPVFCEDFLLNESLGQNYQVAAVMDGCSSGIQSHFASALIGKLLKQALNTLAQSPKDCLDQKPTAASLSKLLLEKVFIALKQAQQQLGLDEKEILSTLNMMVYDHHRKEAFVHLTGDGCVVMNDSLKSIDQNNTPDYIAYHLSKDFEAWHATQVNFFTAQSPSNVAIASDGVESFRTALVAVPEDLDIPSFFMVEESFAKVENMLVRKFNILDKKYGFQPADDVSIVRWRFENE